MPTIQPYLFFHGKCEEAIEFYKSALGAKVGMLLRFKDNPGTPPPGVVPDGYGDKVMHATVNIGDAVMLMSDGTGVGGPVFKGVSISLGVPTVAEADRCYEALRLGGAVEMPIGKTFFAERFGCVKDKFGVSWMVIAGPTETPPAKS